VAARIVLVTAAVAILAWLTVMERDMRLEKRGIDTASKMVVSGRLGSDGFRSAEADFRAARFLSADATPDLHRAVLYDVHGRVRRATALLEDVVRREPENLAAWNILYSLTRERDPALARRAAAARRRLDPQRFPR
jgi:hypothetical protein